MYSTLLPFHSLFRWLVLASLVFAIYRACRGWLNSRKFTRFDDATRHWTATIAHIQLLLGLWLYAISPVIAYFLDQYKVAVHQREVRFFGMEHSLVMVVSVVIITIGSMRARRKEIAQDKFKTMAIWYSIGLLLILSSVPWSFSPLVSRPLFRPLW